MPDEKPFRTTADLVYPAVELGQSVWKIGVYGLELIGTIQRTAVLNEDLLRSAVDWWGKFRDCLQNDLDWWVSDDTPAFETTASSYVEAVFRRLERIGRYAFYAGERFVPGRLDFPPVDARALDYELASAFVHRHIANIDLAAAVTGLRKEVIRNVARPMCRLPWEPACIREWRFQMFMEMLEAAPDYHWKLSYPELLRAIREAVPAGKGLPRLTADPDTKTVYLDGREVASQLPPEVLLYVSAVIAAHPHPIPFAKIQSSSRLTGKNQTRLRGLMQEEFPRLAALIAANHSGHFLQLPEQK